MPALRVTALAGGIGAARFLTGLLAALGESHPDAQVTVIGNTADDVLLHGMHISPDLDTVMYTLGGGVHPDQGWGRADEAFTVSDELRAYGVGPDWFTLGDRDVATHVVRTQMLLGYPLSQVTAALCRRWLADLPVEVRLLPMSDDRVETHVVALDPETGRRAMHFQEWWVRYRAALPAEQIALVGIESATPAPGVVAAIEQADVVLLPPSNPVVSIGPILSVPGVRAALAAASAPVVGVSPIIGGAPVRGMADACLAAIGVATSALAVAGLYADVLDGWLVDSSDAAVLGDLDGVGVAARAVPLLMSDAATTRAIAAEALDLALSLRV
ncbi:MAG: 2-phospho-L-lactate transferase [Jiangellales bacterium]